MKVESSLCKTRTIDTSAVLKIALLYGKFITNSTNCVKGNSGRKKLFQLPQYITTISTNKSDIQ